MTLPAKIDLKTDLKSLYQASAKAVVEVVTRKRLAATAQLWLEAFPEGRCAQTLHLGPFSEESPSIEKLHRFNIARGRLAGRHHEIYLSDIRRADPAKGRTIIRQPMA